MLGVGKNRSMNQHLQARLAMFPLALQKSGFNPCWGTTKPFVLSLSKDEPVVGHSGRSSLCSGQVRHLCPILSHHCLLFLATPAFDLSFAGERLLASRKRLGKDEL